MIPIPIFESEFQGSELKALTCADCGTQYAYLMSAKDKNADRLNRKLETGRPVPCPKCGRVPSVPGYGRLAFRAALAKVWSSVAWVIFLGGVGLIGTGVAINRMGPLEAGLPLFAIGGLFLLHRVRIRITDPLPPVPKKTPVWTRQELEAMTGGKIEMLPELLLEWETQRLR
ncbi:MAG: hypothetical protein PHU85_01215 [Phycisphaerae bacterium]|nr:hypothetical protein [Phycisphaerae bacterium]